MGSNLNTFKDV